MGLTLLHIPLHASYPRLHEAFCCKYLCHWVTLNSLQAGLILGFCPANERRRYFATTSLIGWVQTWNQPCYILMPDHMMASWHGNPFCISGPLWWESQSLVDSPHKWPVVMSFDVISVVGHLHKLLNKQLSCQWFETPWWQCDVTVMKTTNIFANSNFEIHFLEWQLLSLSSISIDIFPMGPIDHNWIW